MPRAFLVVMDSVGIGGAPDAHRFYNGDLPDFGADTLGHIALACAEGRAETGRSGPLRLPVLDSLGLGRAMALSTGRCPVGMGAEPAGLWGMAEEVSGGKDTPSGHWELAGLPVPWDWTCFPDHVPAFPEDLLAEVCALAGSGGVLGNCHASGTEIIARLGAEHLQSGWPICYTSADSVFQIAAHEQAYGLERLLELCSALAPRLHAMRVGRVIARPFTGSVATGFQRTGNRRDYAMTPPGPVITTRVRQAGGHVHAIGKIGDIFAMEGIASVVKGDDHALMGHLGDAVTDQPDGSLTFANFVEFDSLFGHRRDVAGYARHLEWFDAAIGGVLEGLRDGDMMILTADHGNDPTWPGTDHTRERVPVLVAGKGAGRLGRIAFADVAESVASHLGLPPNGPGTPFL